MNFKQKDMILIENYIKKVHIYLGEEFLEISNFDEIIKKIKSGAKSINIKFEYISKKGINTFGEESCLLDNILL